MGKEQEITDRLVAGMSPSQMIQEGYNKATIYKVQRSLIAERGEIVPRGWHVEWTTNKSDDRFLPGENMLLNWAFTNLSGFDMYVYNAAAQPEWLQGEWYHTNIRQLLKPGDASKLSWMIPIPSDCTLGERDIRFGLQYQLLVPNSINVNTPNQVEWSDPDIIHLKYSTWGDMFISHSTKDMALVRALQGYLDIYGLEIIVAEDIPEPGRYLPEKFAEKIRQAEFFMALLTTDAALSEWVQQEIRYARQIDKPLILLKEEGVMLPQDINMYEWLPFSHYEDIGNLAVKIMNASEYLSSVAKAKLNSKVEIPVGTIIAGGILAFLGGLALGAAIKSGEKGKE